MSSPSRAPSSLPLRRIDTNAPVSSVREQAKAANMSTMMLCNTIDEILRLNIKNKPYILEGLLRNKFSRNRYSWVWQYGTVTDLGATPSAPWRGDRATQPLPLFLFYIGGPQPSL